MRYSALRTAIIGLSALFLGSCSTQRSLRSEVRSLTTELRSTEARDSVTIELRDTLREVTTITIDRNDKGDTLRQSIVTDRERIRNAVDVRSKTVDVRVVKDTVYIEKRDSVVVKKANISHQTSSISHHWDFRSCSHSPRPYLQLFSHVYSTHAYILR